MAEKSVLGSMMLAEDALEYCIDTLCEDDFYSTSHKIIFACLVRLRNANTDVDTVSVVAELHRMSKLQDAGDAGYIADLLRETPSAANVAYYAKLVQDCSIRRKVIKVGHAMFKDGQAESITAEELLKTAEEHVFAISISEREDTMRKAESMILDVYNEVERARKNKGDQPGVQTGFADLDRKIGCLHNSDLVILAARPGMGKTSLAMNIAQFATLKRNKTVAVFSLEMPRNQLMLRMCASEKKKDLAKVRSGELNDADMADIEIALAELSEANLFIDDASSVTIQTIRSKCRKTKARYGLDLVVIDYLQLMGGTGKRENRNLEVSEITRSAKLLARELDVPILMLSQLSREVERRKSNRPMLSDLRDSGSIEQDADIVIFIADVEDGVADIDIAKNRNGPTGLIYLSWSGSNTTFYNHYSEDVFA